MSRFTRFTRVSAPELCREEERRAWGSAVVTSALCVALVLPGVWIRVSARMLPGGGEPTFRGYPVSQAESPAPREAESHAVEQLAFPQPAVEVTLELPSAAPAPPQLVALEALELPAWDEGGETGEPESLLAWELPARLDSPVTLRHRAESSAPAPAAASAAPAVSASAGGEFVAARYRSAPPPPYPPELRRLRVQGRVGLRVAVDEQGIPRAVEVIDSSGYAAFDRCAREWVLARWRFHPARRGGEAVASSVRTKLTFVLR